MIPILYANDETDFTTNGIGRLSDCISCTVTEERNAVYEMDIEYPMTGIHYSDIENGSYIKAVPFFNGTPQIFFVYEISKPINGRVKIYCAHISYRLSLIPLAPFSATNAKDCFAKLKPNAMEDCPFTFWTDRVLEKAYYLRYPDSMRGKIQGDQWSILQNYKPAELEWDNFTVKMWTDRGRDNGVVLRYGKNITDLKQDESIRNTVTGICPYWYGTVGEEEELVMLPERIIYTQYVDNFPYKRTGVVDLTDQFEEKPTVEQLRSRAQRYINENDIGIPRVSIKLSFIDLAQTEEYKDILPLQEVNLCDIVTVQFDKLGVNAKAKITKTVWNVLLDRYDSVEIGEHHSNLATSFVEQVENTTNIVNKTQVNMIAALRQAQELINGGLGGYIITHTNDEGYPDEIIIMDSPTKESAVNCIRLNKNGIGFSQSGYDGPFNSAWTIDGSFNTQANISANSIAVSMLTGSITNGAWSIDLDNGTFTIGNISANNITTGTLSAARIAANSLGVSKLSGSITNGDWSIDFTNGTMSIGKLSADDLTAGTIDANVVRIINLIVDTIESATADGTLRAYIKGGVMSYQGKTTSSYKDVTRISANEIAGSSPTEYTGLVDIFKMDNTGAYSERSLLTSSSLAVGVNPNVVINLPKNATGEVGAGLIWANSGFRFQNELYTKQTIKGKDATYNALVTGTPTKVSKLDTLSSTAVTAIDASVTVDMKGYSALLIEVNQTSGGTSSFHVVPAGNWSNTTLEFCNNDHRMTINFQRTGTSVTVTLKSKTSTGGFRYIYGM